MTISETTAAASGARHAGEVDAAPTQPGGVAVTATGPDAVDAALTGPGFGSLSVAAILADTAHRRPANPAISWAGGTVTYGELWNETRAYAGALRARGIGRGDRVAVLIPNVPDFARVYYAVLSLGAVVVPIHLLFKSEEIGFVLRDSDAKLLVAAAPVLAEGAKAAGALGVPVLSVLLPDDMTAAVPVPVSKTKPAGRQLWNGMSP